MRLAIFGSRSLGGKKTVKTLCDMIKRFRATHIVTAGEPHGVCEAARHVAKNKGLPLTLHHLQAKERAAGKYHWRSIAVLNDCEHVLFIHDGISQGTINEIALAKKLHKGCTVKRINASEDSGSSGFYEAHAMTPDQEIEALASVMKKEFT